MPASPPESLVDPELLRDDAVDVRETVHEVDSDDFADIETLDSHVVVGIADDRRVLLQNDGHHGWTLPAFPVEPGEDWLAVARREFESLTGVAVAVDTVERLRVQEYRVPETVESSTIYDVVVRATSTDELPEEPASRIKGIELQWFDGVPADVPKPVEADIALFVD